MIVNGSNLKLIYLQQYWWHFYKNCAHVVKPVIYSTPQLWSHTKTQKAKGHKALFDLCHCVPVAAWAWEYRWIQLSVLGTFTIYWFQFCPYWLRERDCFFVINETDHRQKKPPKQTLWNVWISVPTGCLPPLNLSLHLLEMHWPRWKWKWTFWSIDVKFYVLALIVIITYCQL